MKPTLHNQSSITRRILSQKSGPFQFLPKTKPQPCLLPSTGKDHTTPKRSIFTMGNCLFGSGEPDEPKVQVSTSTGAIMEFQPPITAACIVKEFPGHFLFKGHDLFWKPLSLHEELHPGESYCLLKWAQRHAGHVRSKSIPMAPGGTASSKPYRMSFDSHGVLKRSASTEVTRFVGSNSSSIGHSAGAAGVWKVKLVISPEQLVEILAQEARTEELIENVRSVAKCGASRASSMDLSDQWSVSSRSASSN